MNNPKTAQEIIDIITKISGSIYAQKSVEWYEMRSYTVGGSEIGHLVDTDNKYDNGFFKIILDRYSKEPFNASGVFNCDSGTFLEEVTRLVFEKLNNVEVFETGSIEGFCYPQRFSPDGLAVDEKGPILCEFKTPVSRNYVDGYISFLYREQVYTGLLTLYKKYGIHARGMFLDNFMKPAFLDQLTKKHMGACFDRQRVFSGNNYKSIAEVCGNKGPLYMGIVEVIPKNKEEFIEWMINSRVDLDTIAPEDIENIDETSGDELSNSPKTSWDDKKVDLPDDNCICESKCCCSSSPEAILKFSPEEYYTNSLGKQWLKTDLNNAIVDLQKIALYGDITRHIYASKEARDVVQKKVFDGIFTQEEANKIMESMQDFTLIYHPLDVVKPETPGFFIGYKVYCVNQILIELDLDTLEEDIEFRTNCVAHTKSMMDVFNNFIDACKENNRRVVFDRALMKKWFKAAVPKKSNDCRFVCLEKLEDALYTKKFCKIYKVKNTEKTPEVLEKITFIEATTEAPLITPQTLPVELQQIYDDFIQNCDENGCRVVVNEPGMWAWFNNNLDAKLDDFENAFYDKVFCKVYKKKV